MSEQTLRHRFNFSFRNEILAPGRYELPQKRVSRESIQKKGKGEREGSGCRMVGENKVVELRRALKGSSREGNGV